MKISKSLAGIGLAVALIGGGVAVAQKPVENVSGKKHPNIAAAQRLSEQAYEKIVAAQQANEWDMEGHAQKAKDLLDQANRELKAAAETANKNHK
jgi:F0F1-type ATP synthase membrane subunit b/b'